MLLIYFVSIPEISLRTGIAQLVQRLATTWTVWETKPSEGEFFRTRAVRPCGLPNHLYNGYHSFLWCKFAGAWR